MRETDLTDVNTHAKDVNDRLKDHVKHSLGVSNVSSQAMDLNWRDKQHLYNLRVSSRIILLDIIMFANGERSQEFIWFTLLNFVQTS